MSWFPEKNDPELERLAGIVFDLRRELFRQTEYEDGPEREWETTETEKLREIANERALMAWDLQTRRMILGGPPDGRVG
jgi:hypothetical protein